MGIYTLMAGGAHTGSKARSRKAVWLLVAAAIAFVIATAGSAYAALTYFSDDYRAQFATTQLEVSLEENGRTIAQDGELLSWMGDEPLSLGKVYEEGLSARNSGTQDEYVRVVVHRFWNDADGRVTTLDPALIELGFTLDGWIVDESLSTPEQTVLYSIDALAPGDSIVFLESFAISPELLSAYTSATEGNVTTITYDYNGYSFGIFAEVDSVQTHNALDAMRDVWGVGDEVTNQINFGIEG